MADGKRDVRELINQRNPLKRPTVEPVDLYSPPGAATTEATQQPAEEDTTPPSRSQEPPATTVQDIVRPYSTYIRESLIEGIKLRAFKRRMRDRQIVGEALEEYFRNHPVV